MQLVHNCYSQAYVMLIAYRPIACCLFLLSYLFIESFCMYPGMYFFLQRYHYLVNKEIFVGNIRRRSLTAGFHLRSIWYEFRYN